MSALTRGQCVSCASFVWALGRNLRSRGLFFCFFVFYGTLIFCGFTGGAGFSGRAAFAGSRTAPSAKVVFLQFNYLFAC